MNLFRAAATWLVLGFCMVVCACNVTIEPGFNAQCLESIADDALANPRTTAIAANVAGQMGLLPAGDADDPPLETNQVEFATSDGAMHYLAVAGSSWTRAALMRAVPASVGPRVKAYIIDRQANLISASLIENGRIIPLVVRDAQVLEGFRVEQELWRTSGRDEVCGRG